MTTVEIRKPTLSPTALSEYEICGRRGQFYHDPDIPRVTTLGLAKGGAWHTGMETFGQMRLEMGDDRVAGLDPAEVRAEIIEAINEAFHQSVTAPNYAADPEDDLEQATKDLITMVDAWQAEPHNQWMGPDVTIEAVEAEVIAELGSPSHQFHGVIDSVYNLATYGTVLTDFKTAARRWSHTGAGDGKGDGNPRKLVQAPLYAEAWLRSTGEQVNWFAYDVMTYAGHFERVWVDVRPEVRAPFVQRWNDISDMITTYAGMDLPTNPGAMLCSQKWCSFWTYCPMGEGLDVARKTKQTNE